ncbi:beta-glucosidase [Bradyrhizobium sp. CCBAU 51745]|uniref:GH1 family beta-glucosidase n=1 Tax=Bradyrhizobium sp. CCBAU 51745 TaxID=1325099 RepID=UPI00230549A1|nr:GH1 family beta-glucosidase [Bradyrhizobium sp. CCBAU 51745]MDA9440043.1 beta-glucosidase [Bradyrhizobium sp. CCBAU 51745]
MSTIQLPNTANLRPGFIWGVSTSSFQIEGATREDGRGPSIWDIYCQSGMIKNRDTGDVACDHYHRYREDVALMKILGVQAYRFSIAWPRILPQGRGAANEAGLSFYDSLIDELMAVGIEPWLCLYHWDLPQALEEHGGWQNREIVTWFADYAALVATRFGDRVKRFATLNEPSMFSLFSRSLGKRDRSSEDKLHRMIHHVNLAHGAAVDVVRAKVADASIGCIHNRQPCRPSSSSEADAAAAARLDVYWNSAFPDPQCLGAYPAQMRSAIEPHLQPGDLSRICRPVDWFGLNHYSPVYVKANPDSMLGYDFGDKPVGTALTPIDWPIDPKAFEDTLQAAQDRYGLPIYVLENGYGNFDQPDATGAVTDTGRVEFLRDYIDAMNAATSRGVDVRGYFVWSLLDNFEWDSGYSIRFGLTYVDYASLRRTPKSSFDWYAGLIKAGRP